MASDRPFEAFLAAARGAIAHLHLPVIHFPGSNSSCNPNPNPKQQQQEEEPKPDCLLHLHVVVTNFLHKPLRSFARCFRGDDTKRKRPGGKHSRPLRDQPQPLELLLCIAFDAFAHNLHVLEDACKQKGAEFGIATRQSDQFQLLRKVMDGKRADFDGFLSNLGFAKVGALPARAGIMGASPAPAPVGDQEEDGAGIEDREGVDNASGTPQPAQKLPARLLNIPLSNVERLRSTLSAVSLTELIELVPQLVSRSSTSADGHPDKKKLFSVQDFFRYAEIEGKRFFEELDRDGDGQVTLEDLEIAMRKRRLPRRYARDFLRRTRSNFFSKSIGWKQYLSLMEQKEATILRAYTTLCLSKSGTLHKNQITACLYDTLNNVQSLASFCSTVLGTAVRIPCEVLKQRLQAGIFNNVGEAIVGTMRQDGPKGFFRGTGATLCREVPFYVAGMCLYAEAKKAAQHVAKRDLEPWEIVAVGALSGGLAAVLTTPFDVMKTRMMTAPPGTPVSMQTIVFSILGNEGPLGLFKGAIPRFFWIAPLGAMNFAGYELAKKAMIEDEKSRESSQEKKAVVGSRG